MDKSKAGVEAEQNLVKRGTQPFKIPLSLLVVKEGLNVRTDYGAVEELGWRAFNSTDSFHNIPLVGFKEEGKFVVVHGHSRRLGLVFVSENKEKMLEQFKAELPAELPKSEKNILVEEKRDYINSLLSAIPFIVEPVGVTNKQRVIDMVNTNAGRPLSPLELGGAVKRLFDEKMDIKQIASTLSLSAAYIGKLMQLIASPPEFLELVKNGTLSSTLAIQIASEGKAGEFVVKHKAGDFQKGASISGPGNLNGEQMNQGPPAVQKITKKDLTPKGANSWKFFDKFSKNADVTKMTPEAKNAFEFMVKVKNNEAVIEDFFTFFSQQ